MFREDVVAHSCHRLATMVQIVEPFRSAMVRSMGVSVEGTSVRIRDATLDDADLLDSWATVEAKGSFNDFGMPRSPADREALARGPRRGERQGELIIERTGDGRP